MAKVLLKTGVSCFALAMVLLLLPMPSRAVLSAQEQQQGTQQPPPPPPDSAQPPTPAAPPSDQPNTKKRKVWTNDDVIQLRTPADEYLAEREAREAAEAAEARRRAEARPEKTLPSSMTLPETVEETQVQIDKREKQVLHDQATLDYLKAELPNTTADQQPDKQKEIDAVSTVLEKTRKEIKALQGNLERLRRLPPSEKVAPASPPPNS